MSLLIILQNGNSLIFDVNVFNLQDSSLREYNIGTCSTGTIKRKQMTSELVKINVQFL